MKLHLLSHYHVYFGIYDIDLKDQAPRNSQSKAKMLPVQKCFNLNLNNYFKFNLKLKLNFEF